MMTITGRPSETEVAMALDRLALLTVPEHEAVLRALAERHPTLVLAAVRDVETPWHGKVE